MSYWSYYLAWTFLAYALRNPWLLVGVAVFLVLRKIIPDPTAIVRALSRSGPLRTQVALNPANVTARRDLAQIYLDVLRPGAALGLIEQALARTPDEPEMLYLAGVALHRVGRHEEALPKLVRAVEIDPRVRFGLPYLTAGDALFALGRYDQAADAYERYTESNSSDVAGYIRLARALAKQGHREDAKKALDEAERTYRVLPPRMRQRILLRGFLGPRWARATLLGDPVAIALFVVILVVCAALLAGLAPMVLSA
ncbi:MAG TPA: tetratricopeptide repeat protein [Polyangiaceae bacterium]|nr:tetratricopeptide repeat protein [Polyangiaceae bacterium]